MTGTGSTSLSTDNQDFGAGVSVATVASTALQTVKRVVWTLSRCLELWADGRVHCFPGLARLGVAAEGQAARAGQVADVHCHGFCVRGDEDSAVSVNTQLKEGSGSVNVLPGSRDWVGGGRARASGPKRLWSSHGDACLHHHLVAVQEEAGAVDQLCLDGAAGGNKKRVRYTLQVRQELRARKEAN